MERSTLRLIWRVLSALLAAIWHWLFILVLSHILAGREVHACIVHFAYDHAMQCKKFMVLFFLFLVEVAVCVLCKLEKTTYW